MKIAETRMDFETMVGLLPEESGPAAAGVALTGTVRRALLGDAHVIRPHVRHGRGRDGPARADRAHPHLGREPRQRRHHGRTRPAAIPYRRKAPVFRTFFDREVGADTVKVTGSREDKTPFPEKYDPSNPAPTRAAM